MEKPDQSQTITVEEPIEVTQDEGTANEEHSQDQGNGFESQEVPNSNEGSGEGAPDEAPGDGESEAGQNEQVDYKAQFDSLKQELEALKKAGNPQPQQNQPVALTEKDFEVLENQSGLGRQQLQWITQFNTGIIQRVMSAIEERFGGVLVDQTISKLTSNPQFKDAGNYSQDIHKFLADLPPAMRSNEKWLEKAYTFAKAVSSQNSRSKIIKDRERNKRVITQIGQNRPGPKSSSKSVSNQLSDFERRSAREGGMTEQEYVSWKNMTAEKFLRTK